MIKFDKIREAIEEINEKKITNWDEFIKNTDIGQIIALNKQVNFKNDRGEGVFIKLDDETFAQIKLSNGVFSIISIPKDDLKGIAGLELVDFDNPDYATQFEQDMDSILKLEEFAYEDVEILKRRIFVKELKKDPTLDLTDENIDSLFDMFLNGEFSLNHFDFSQDWLNKKIINTPRFKEKLINFVINESPENEDCKKRIEALFRGFGALFLGEDILENKEFMESLNKNYFTEEAVYRFGNTTYKSYGFGNAIYKLYGFDNATEAISFFMFRDYNRNGKFEDKEFLEQKIDYIARLTEENNGDLSYLKGAIPPILDNNPEYAVKILSISKDKEIVSRVIGYIPPTKFENLEYSKKILEMCSEDEHVFKVLSGMNKDDLENPEIMLGIVEACPRVLGVLSEHDYYSFNAPKEKNEKLNYIYTHLQENETFQKGLFEMVTKRISQSEVEKHYSQPKEYGRHGRYGRTIIPAKTWYTFKEGTPMREFEDRMSYKALKCIADITYKYYEEQQKKLENPEFTSDELINIKFSIEKEADNNGLSGPSFAYAVRRAERIRQIHKEEQAKTGKITPSAAAKNALESGVLPEDIEKTAGLDGARQEPDYTNEKRGEEIDD